MNRALNFHENHEWHSYLKFPFILWATPAHEGFEEEWKNQPFHFDRFNSLPIWLLPFEQAAQKRC